MNLYKLLQQLWYHLQLTLGTDIRNGAAADIALSLSMAGILSPSCNNNNNNNNNKLLVLLSSLLYQIMDLLTHIATMEIQWKQTKGSRRAIDILIVLEKLAAAGCSYQPPTTTTTTTTTTAAATTATATATTKTTSTTTTRMNPYYSACQAAAIQSLPGSKQYQNL